MLFRSVFFVPLRRGQGRSPGPYIMDQLNAAVPPAQRSRMLVALHEVQLQDQLAALGYLRSLTYVDQNRLVVMGASFGGIQTMLGVERRSGYRIAVSCSAAAQTWRESPDLRARLTAAASKATIPVFFLQAENDYDLTPNRVLSEEVGKAGQSVETKIYPAFGSGAQEGHNFCWRGTNIWGPDVLQFIETHLKPGWRWAFPAGRGDRPELLDAVAADADIPVVGVDGRVAAAGASRISSPSLNRLVAADSAGLLCSSKARGGCESPESNASAFKPASPIARSAAGSSPSTKQKSSIRRS